MRTLSAFCIILFCSAYSAAAELHKTSLDIEVDGTLSFELSKGPIQPQLTSLLMNHPNVKGESYIVWSAPDAESSALIVQGKTIDSLINDVSKSVNLSVTYYPNGYFLVQEQINE